MSLPEKTPQRTMWMICLSPLATRASRLGALRPKHPCKSYPDVFAWERLAGLSVLTALNHSLGDVVAEAVLCQNGWSKMSKLPP